MRWVAAQRVVAGMQYQGDARINLCPEDKCHARSYCCGVWINFETPINVAPTYALRPKPWPAFIWATLVNFHPEPNGKNFAVLAAFHNSIEYGN